MTISAALLLLALTGGLVYFGGMRPVHALIAFLAGFLIAASSAGPDINDLIDAIGRLIHQL